MSLTFVLWS